MRLIKVGFWILVICNCVLAATIRVPQDQPTIQAGINAAVNGDTVLVGPGVWFQNVRFLGKKIVLASSSGPEFTSIIAANADSATVTLAQGEPKGSVLDGFTVSGSEFSGVYCQSSHPTITNCRVTGNSSSDNVGAGITLRSTSNSLIRNNRIFANIAESYAGAISVADDGYPSVNDTICYNIIYNNGGAGDIRALHEVDGLQIHSNTLSSLTWSAILIQGGVGSIDIRNNIIFNAPVYGIQLEGVGSISAEYNCLFSNSSNSNVTMGAGNVLQDAAFFEPILNDYRLNGSSPCIDAGDPDPIYNDPDGSRNDMGAIPFMLPGSSIRHVPAVYPTIQSAINASVDGDTVLIGDGQYYERVHLLGKNLVLASYMIWDGDTSHVVNTVINGDTLISPLESDTGSVIWTGFRQGGNVCSIVGLTITGGSGTPTEYFEVSGGGIMLAGGTYKIRSCRIVDNSAESGGGIGSIGSFTSSLTISRSEIAGNSGGSLRLLEVTTEIDSTKIESGPLNVRGSHAIFTGCDLRDCQITPFSNVIEFVDSRINYSEFIDCCYRVESYGSFFDSCNVTGSSVSFGLHSSVFKGSEMFIGGVDRHLWIDSSEVTCNVSLAQSYAYIRNSLVRGEIRLYGEYDDIYLAQSTLIGSISQPAPLGRTYLDSSIVFTDGQPAIDCWAAQNSRVYVNCSVIAGATGPWLTGTPLVLDTAMLFFANPLFCDTAAGDYSIKNSSPCAPANNSCGVLIGAYGIGCQNVAPQITSVDSLTQIARTRLAYQPSAIDEDGPAMIYSYVNLPHWLAQIGDSVIGIPGLNDSDTTFLAIVSDGFLADSIEVAVHVVATPLIDSVTVEGHSAAMHVVSSMPHIDFAYADPTGAYPQTAFEIAVGTDNDWQFAEMWNPAPFATADTFVVYAGAPLVDGQTYWLRLRVSNSLGWSNWAELMFRMNSVPSIPILFAPPDGGIVTSLKPDLTVRRVSDSEGDSLLLTFEIASDSLFSFFLPFTAKPSADSLFTVGVPFPLTEDQPFWWRVKASDYFEESAYSVPRSFWVNTANSAPTPFDLMSPASGFEPALTTVLPLLQWTQSNDFDPLDEVSYAVHLALDSTFSFANVVTGITGTSWQVTSPLNWGTKYWWKVRATDLSTEATWSNQVFRFRIMRPGDADGNGLLTISDAVFLINYIFGGGPAPNPLLSGDADCNGIVTISDAVYLIQYIFGGGPPPCEA